MKQKWAHQHTQRPTWISKVHRFVLFLGGWFFSSHSGQILGLTVFCLFVLFFPIVCGCKGSTCGYCWLTVRDVKLICEVNIWPFKIQPLRSINLTMLVFLPLGTHLLCHVKSKNCTHTHRCPLWEYIHIRKMHRHKQTFLFCVHNKLIIL